VPNPRDGPRRERSATSLLRTSTLTVRSARREEDALGVTSSIYRRVKPFVPESAAPAVDALRRRRSDDAQRRWRSAAEAALQAYLRERCGNFFQEVDPGPPWTRELVLQTAVQHDTQVDVRLNSDRFFATGTGLMLRYLRVAEVYGFNLRTARAAYEIGVGSARVLRHLRAVHGLHLVGSDINEASTTWCVDNVSGIEFHRNQLDPPLAFACDNAFDLAFAQSVFTHIPMDTQDAWIAEMARVIRPGGLFLCTVEGVVKQREMLTPQNLAELERVGALTLDASHENVSVSTKVTDTWDVFLLRDRLLANFGRHFDVLDYLPGHQDLMVLRVPHEGQTASAWPPPSEAGAVERASTLWR
jgi:SAM-dependent methyltransferase